ncbi:LacI family transcriptional regulator [Pelagibacterium flavum]|uniref:LacI family transcriptional regulator n=1 Tax=Pelagibacterium flavum TaxID=2984530 RepID=A0ABY6IUN7_9HYPH|nr:LacI family transcriptional regulator [Pelagibacterium sp. YIM 151497]
MLSKKKTGVTITDVARLAGVSTATAGRVLGDYGYSSREKREKVLSAAQALGYRPNLLARSLITGRTKTIGVVAGDIQSPFYASILRGISNVAERNDFGLIITNSDENIEHEIRSVRLLLEKQVDGMIVSPCDPEGGEHLVSVVAAGIPIVQIDRQVHSLGADFVGVDNKQGAHDAVARLLAQGHRRIGMIGELGYGDWSIEEFFALASAPSYASDSLYPSWQRLHGYVEAHREAGVPLDPMLIGRSRSYSAQGAQHQAQMLLSNKSRPTALFTADGLMTEGTMAAVAESDLALPDDLSVICFDDLDWMGFVRPRLDAVAQPRGAMGEAAAQLLLDRIAGNDEPEKRIVMRTRQIVRGSVAPPRALPGQAVSVTGQ